MAIALGPATPSIAEAQGSSPPPVSGSAPALAPAPALTYVDVVALTLDAPIILRGSVVRMKRLRGAQAAGAPAGSARFLMEVAVHSVLVAPAAVPPTVRYLWETRLDPRGRAPRLTGAGLLLFLRPVPGRDDQQQLANAAGQVPLDPVIEGWVRGVLTERTRGDLAGLRVTGVGRAFHVPGSVPGEAESQIFLTTVSRRPVSLVVLTRPGQPRRYAAAFGELVDEAAGEVPPRTLLWYYLACGLPPDLPPASVEGQPPEAQAALAADYRFVLDQLGPCARTLPR